MGDSRRHRVLLVVVSSALASSATALAAAPTRAALTDCTAEEVCVWPAANYGGAVTTVADDVCHDAAVGSAYDNDGDTTQELRVYPQPGCQGAITVVASTKQSANLSGKSYMNHHKPGSAP